jgi:hypothetical protein
VDWLASFLHPRNVAVLIIIAARINLIFIVR